LSHIFIDRRTKDNSLQIPLLSSYLKEDGLLQQGEYKSNSLESPVSSEPPIVPSSIKDSYISYRKHISSAYSNTESEIESAPCTYLNYKDALDQYQVITDDDLKICATSEKIQANSLQDVIKEGLEWNERFQKLWDEKSIQNRTHATDAEKVNLRLSIGLVAKSFSDTALTIGQQIISELHLPLQQVLFAIHNLSTLHHSKQYNNSFTLILCYHLHFCV
jgi:hypothetical protein